MLRRHLVDNVCIAPTWQNLACLRQLCCFPLVWGVVLTSSMENPAFPFVSAASSGLLFFSLAPHFCLRNYWEEKNKKAHLCHCQIAWVYLVLSTRRSGHRVFAGSWAPPPARSDWSAEVWNGVCVHLIQNSPVWSPNKLYPHLLSCFVILKHLSKLPLP